MKSPSLPIPLRKLITVRLVEGCAVTVMIVGLIFWWRYVRDVRVAVDQATHKLQEAPAIEQRQLELSQTLENYAHDLARVRALLTPRENIGDFVDTLEIEAAQRGIVLQVPDIKEVVKLDESNKPIPQTGPFGEISLTLRATGTPANLLDYTFRLEHLPYLLRVTEWELKSVSSPAATTLRSQLATRVLPEGEELVLIEKPGNLEATLILTVRQ